MKPILSLLCVAAVAQMSYGRISDYTTQNGMNTALVQQTNVTALANTIRFFSYSARGLISGYRRGMYKDVNYKIDAECFDAKTQGYMLNVITAIG